MRAKLFWNGRSQAVRLPKAFRFDGDEVEIRSEGEEVVLTPVPRERFPDGYWEEVDTLVAHLDLQVVELMAWPLLDVDLETEEE